MTSSAAAAGGPGSGPAASILRTVRAVVSAVRLATVACAVAAGAVLMVLVLLQMVDVVFRNTTGASAVRGVAEYISVGLVLVVFLSIAYAEKQAAHVRTPVLMSRLPRRLRLGLRALGLVVSALVMWALAWATLGRAIDAFEAGEVAAGVARVPSWPSRFAVPLGAFLLGVELVSRALLLDGEEPDQQHLHEGSVL
jgi:TRAP-type mannitol/chloroaromatic compound transport system permease small subunit